MTWGRGIPYDDLVMECLCFGWIDSTVRTIDDDRSAIRLTPRRPGSGWSRPNKVRLEYLMDSDLMTPAGRAVIERAQADGSWTFLDDIEDLIVPDDLAEALRRGSRGSVRGADRGPPQTTAVLDQVRQTGSDALRSDRADGGRCAGRTLSAGLMGPGLTQPPAWAGPAW